MAIIAVDFDGTTVTHEYPKVGRPIGAAQVLRLLVNEGHHLILYTMRSGALLEEALAWYAARGIPLLGANTNPSQAAWTSSPKVFAHLYIDDAALGIPLKLGRTPGERPYVDWFRVKRLLVQRGLLPADVL